MKYALLFSVCVSVLTINVISAHAEQFVSLQAGEFDVIDDNHAFVGVQWQGDAWTPELQIHPIAGVIIDKEKDVYGYGGVGFSMPVATDITVMPSFSVGAYHQDSDVDLGGTLEFRSAIEGSLALEDKSRIGLELSHISNAGLHDYNPGTETLAITWKFPFK